MSLYEDMHEKFIKGITTVETLNKLVKAKLLTQDQVETIINDRDK